MKAITPCQQRYSPLLGCCGTKQSILHLYYKLSDLQAEIEKRSSYLGKFRKTEQEQHLLELLSMTKDEEDLFYSFAKAAMADVFDALHMRTPEIEKAYLFNEGKNAITITPVPELNIVDCTFNQFNSSISRLIVNLTTNPAITLSPYTCSLTLNIPYTVSYSLLTPGSPLITEQRVLTATSTQFQIGTTGYNVVFYLTIPLAAATTDFTSETLVSIDWTSGETILSAIADSSIKANAPETYNEGDYVLCGGKLYIAKSDGDNNDLSPLELQEGDYQESIHYVMHYPSTLNHNMVEPLDTAVEEAIVNRIIYKWLVLSYPDEAPIYLQQYQEAVEQIYKRFAPASPFAHRTPRII